MLPSEIGESWFGVETTARPEESLTSQAQPEPKRAIPAFLNSSLKASKEPNASAIAAVSYTHLTLPTIYSV